MMKPLARESKFSMVRSLDEGLDVLVVDRYSEQAAVAEVALEREVHLHRLERAQEWGELVLAKLNVTKPCSAVDSSIELPPPPSTG